MKKRRLDDAVLFLEARRNKAQLTIVSFVAMLPIARATYYGWLSGRVPDPYRIKECVQIAKRLSSSK